MSMSMGSNLFQLPNMALARDFWYIIAGILGGFLVVRAVNFYKSRSRYVSYVEATDTDI